MLFVTNRFPKGSIRTRKNRKFVFDIKNNSVANSVYFCEQLPQGGCIELGNETFLQRLKDEAHEQLLVYIHGFSNMPEQVLQAAGEFQQLCETRGAGKVLVVPFIWPCDNDFGVVKDYWDDQKAADASALAFSRVLGKFDTWRNDKKANPPDAPCLKRINVLAHSMGNRVLRETLDAWRHYDLADGVPLLFRNTFLVAADVVNETLHRGEKGEVVCHASRNVVVYYASDDLALRSSKAANLKNKVASRRLGHSGPEDMSRTPANVYRVDCDDVNTRYDLKGHSYFRADPRTGRSGVVFDHIFDTVARGRVFPGDEDRRSIILTDPGS